MQSSRRSLRRTNPVTIVLAAILTFGFLYFIFSSPVDGLSPPVKHHIDTKQPAYNFLSPPSLPFLKPKDPRARQPPPPVVHYRLNSVTTSAKPVENRETILILTPLARYYPEYLDNILRFTYPRELISVGFIIPKDTEGNAATTKLQERIAEIQAQPEGKRFASITILRQDFNAPLETQAETTRHKMENQKLRRAAMAKARNSLLFTTLGPTTSWVLWLDADIVETPPTLIEDLAAHDKPIIVPNCFQRFLNESNQWDVRPYDYNSWIDSDVAKDMAKSMDSDAVLLEGYREMATFRTLLAFMIDEETKHDKTFEVELDGVGGTALLVKAEVHRDGAMFPPFPFYHLIETEGFAKMAKRLGWQSWGLPNYYIYHINE